MFLQDLATTVRRSSSLTQKLLSILRRPPLIAYGFESETVFTVVFVVLFVVELINVRDLRWF